MNLLKLIRSTRDVVKVAEMVASVAGKAARNQNLRDSVQGLANRAKGWRPIRSKSEKLDRKLAAITEYADELHEQFEMAVTPFLKLCFILYRKNANLRAQRDLLLPKLISGEIDVSDIPMPT